MTLLRPTWSSPVMVRQEVVSFPALLPHGFPACPGRPRMGAGSVPPTPPPGAETLDGTPAEGPAAVTWLALCGPARCVLLQPHRSLSGEVLEETRGFLLSRFPVSIPTPPIEGLGARLVGSCVGN